jgi:hypothetical protein
MLSLICAGWQASATFVGNTTAIGSVWLRIADQFSSKPAIFHNSHDKIHAARTVHKSHDTFHAPCCLAIS